MQHHYLLCERIRKAINISGGGKYRTVVLQVCFVCERVMVAQLFFQRMAKQQMQKKIWKKGGIHRKMIFFPASVHFPQPG